MQSTPRQPLVQRAQRGPASRGGLNWLLNLPIVDALV
jgi:hypothetical protein